MNDAYNPNDVTVMTGEGVRWTEPASPIVWATVLEKLDTLMRNEPTMWRYL